MTITQSLKSHSLELLLQLIVVGNENILEAKRDYQDNYMIVIYQKVLSKIQSQIAIKQRELLSR